jgi:Protein of unknown function (DUF2510)
MVTGVVLGAASLGVFAASVGMDALTSFSSPVQSTPTVITEDLDEGTYLIYERTGSRREMGPFFNEMDRGVTLTGSDVTVRGPDGSEVTVLRPTIDETLDRGNEIYTGALRFTVETAGVHRIDIDSQGQQVIVAPSLAGAFVGGIGWLAAAGVAGLLGLVGLILLIIGFVRGHRTAPALAPAVAGSMATPAGWYADPRGDARLRWWDGQQWSDHVS